MNHFFLTLLISSVICVSSCKKNESHPQPSIPTRIISLAPSITETLFALGLGDRVIGVTGYCTYPPQACTREKIGGYTDANLEKIITMRPDLVVLSLEHEKQRQYLERFNIPVLSVTNVTCAEVCSTFAIIGRYCGVTSAADSLIRLFSERFLAQRNDTMAMHPKVLFCVGRDNPGARRISGVFAAGKGTFYDDLIGAAGGRNALESRGPAYARLSMEGILAAAPDIIIDITSSMGHPMSGHIREDWLSIKRLPAVANGQVYFLSNDYCTIPGPRLPLLFDDIKNVIAAYHHSMKNQL